MNSGQLCIRSDFVLIESSLANAFISKLKEYTQKGFSDKKALGNVINQFHHDRLCKLMEDHQGAVVIGNPNSYEDKNLTPSVILNPSPESAIMKEEIFGPLLPVFTYKNIDEAIQFINKMDKPLAVYYFGPMNGKNGQRVKMETSSGAFLVNEATLQFINQYTPFGGVGASGYGRCHGFEGFKQCSN